MRERLRQFEERIDALSLRERALVFSAVTAAVLALLHALLLDGPIRKERQLSSTIAQRQAEMKALESQITKVAMSRSSDPDRPQRERLAEARRELARIDALIAEEQRKFTDPAQMKKVVAEMLARQRSVQLTSMRTLPATSIADARAGEKPSQPAKEASAAERLIYRHGLEVRVSGPFLDLVRYLAELERLPTQLYWSSLELDATRYPTHSLKIVVYTLSLDPAWLTV